MSDEYSKNDTNRNNANKEDIEIISETLNDIQSIHPPKIDKINKRIDFDKRTMLRLETMIPYYSGEFGDVDKGEALSLIIQKAVNDMFENEFRKKIGEL